MKRTINLISILTIAFSALSSFEAAAQQTDVPEGYEAVDSVIYRHVSSVDTELEGKNIFNVLPSEVNVRQSQQISNSMKAHVAGNSKRELSGYRVRIFFDNKQSARGESEATLNRFRSLYPEIRAYRIYTNPYFKVTVGDFRTKSEAMALLVRIKGAFPSAFVVKENIGYPIVDKDNAVVSDTIKVLRPVGK